MAGNQPYADSLLEPALQPRGVFAPRANLPPIGCQDSTSGFGVGSYASGASFQLTGTNLNRCYILIQNNTSNNIALAIGGANNQGLLIVPGGYYERQINGNLRTIFTQSVYCTLLGAPAATDYVTIEEGSLQTS